MNRKPNKWCKRYKNVRKRISAVQTFFNIFLSMLHFWYPIYYWSLKGEAVKNWGGCIAQKLSSFFQSLLYVPFISLEDVPYIKLNCCGMLWGCWKLRGLFYIVNRLLFGYVILCVQTSWRIHLTTYIKRKRTSLQKNLQNSFLGTIKSLTVLYRNLLTHWILTVMLFIELVN